MMASVSLRVSTFSGHIGSALSASSLDGTSLLELYVVKGSVQRFQFFWNATLFALLLECCWAYVKQRIVHKKEWFFLGYTACRLWTIMLFSWFNLLGAEQKYRKQ